MKAEKVCKGINKAKDFEGCGEIVPSKTRKFGLCGKCFWDWMQNTEGGRIHYQKQFMPKVRKKTETEKRKRTKKEREEMTNWRDDKLQPKLQEIARLLDIGRPCLARGYHADQMHGGHVFSKGANPSMALNLHAIHRQSAQSNHNGNDDGLMRDGIVREYGRGYMDFLFGLKKAPALRYSNLQYLGFYRKACKIANELKRKGEVFNMEERIEMRNRINLELEIYREEECEYRKATENHGVTHTHYQEG